ncbi:hypothetical protein [Dyella silvae]|uniref:hypothetical protein n=1 Tax=Dyella silvae TaxID=2994424 RepID=UPI00226561FA|nr:hypothetical protein [Dyella silvae]
MHDTQQTITQQQQIAFLLTIVNQLRAIRAIEGCLTFTEVVARHVGTVGYSVLAEVAAELDAATPAEVDAELSKLWAGALASATTAN